VHAAAAGEGACSQQQQQTYGPRSTNSKQSMAPKDPSNFTNFHHTILRGFLRFEAKQ
jgi:hypothetical protein